MLSTVFNSKYEEVVSLVGAYLESPEEYQVNEDKYLLEIKKFTLMEKYGDSMVATHGRLRIVYNKDFEIAMYEFVSNDHQEIPLKEGNLSNINEFGITPQFSRMLIVRDYYSLDL